MSKLDYIIEQANIINSTEVTKPVENPKTVDSGYLVKVTTGCLRIRKEPTTDSNIEGTIEDMGIYTIVEEATGKGANLWGKLKSGAGWISLDYTEKYNKSTPTPTPIVNDEIKKGDKVKVKNGAKTYTGGGLASFVYSNIYDVIQVNGDRVVIGKGNIVTAAVHKDNLIKQ